MDGTGNRVVPAIRRQRFWQCARQATGSHMDLSLQLGEPRRQAAPGARFVHGWSLRRLAVTATAAYRIVKLPPIASIAAARPASSWSSFVGANWL